MYYLYLSILQIDKVYGSKLETAVTTRKSKV
jgi:hypothetical protein